MAAVLLSLPVVAMFAALSREYWLRLFEIEGPGAERQFLVWAGKGLAVPTIFWIVINSGLLPGMPILLPEIALAKSRGGDWFRLLAQSCAPVLLITGSFWAAISFGWMQALVVGRAKDRRDCTVQFAFWSMLLFPVAGLIFYLLGPGGLGLALLVWLLPVVHLTLPLAQEKKMPPCYARAIARMKFGKYKDAELEVVRELEKCEEDFDGWLMLAELYANHFDDLPEADRTIRELCAQPNITGLQISLALHRLADWHLNRGADPVSARNALEEICQRLPKTHFARMARLRVDQLPATREELLEQRQPKTFRLPALQDDLDETPLAHSTETNLSEAKTLADKCVEKLRQNPDDIAAREKFAVILAERLGEAVLAIEQLDLLLAMPDQPDRKSAEWLALIAAWQIKYRQNREAARVRLERLVREFPQTPQAFAAQRRLSLMEIDERFRKARSGGSL